MLNIAIIEDDPEYIDAFKYHFTKVSQTINCSFAVDSIEKFLKYYKPNLTLDIVLVDIQLPGISGVKGVPKIRKLNKQIEIIMLTSIEDNKAIFQAITGGANGYLLKSMSFAEIETELLKTVQQGAAISPQVARRIIRHFQPPGSKQGNPTIQQLTAKEKQITQLVIDGKSYEEIAPLLGLTINGLKYHVKNIYKKLQVKSKSSLIKKWFSFD